MQENRVTFTEEAKKALDAEVEAFHDELVQWARDEAFQSRGEPTEVVAVDIIKARSRLIKRQSELKAPTEFILRFYMVLGILMFVGGLGSPFLIQLLHGDNILPLSIAFTGLVMVLLSYTTRYWLKTRRETQLRRAMRAEERLRKVKKGD